MTTTNAYVQDKIRCWYYPRNDHYNLASLGLGYANFMVSDSRNRRAEKDDFALVICKQDDRYYAHVSVIDTPPLSQETFISVWGINFPDVTVQSLDASGNRVYGVRHLTRIHEITDLVESDWFGQGGLAMQHREKLLVQLLELG